MNKDEFYMKQALEEANIAYQKGEVPVGAVIVLDDKIVGRGHNLREMTKDITNHAELIAIRDASKKIGDWRLINTTMYVTLFPCPMCASAIVSSRINKLVTAAPTFDIKTKEIVLKILEGNNTSPKVILKENVLESESKKILSEFFKEQRKNT